MRAALGTQGSAKSSYAQPKTPKASSAGGRPGSECAARHERSNERGRGAAGSPSYPDSFFVQRGVSSDATGRKAWIRQHDMTLPRRQRLEGEHASLRPRTLKQRLERAVIEFERLCTRPAFGQPASAAV